MEQLRADLFSCPAFALDQYRDICLGDSLYFVPYRLHCGGFTEGNIHRRQIEGRSGFRVMNQVNFPSKWGREKSAMLFIMQVARQSADDGKEFRSSQVWKSTFRGLCFCRKRSFLAATASFEWDYLFRRMDSARK
jgi:hypothetical protein